MRKKRYWYVLAYDVRNPKRLQRTHALIKKNGVALQKSVFLIRANHDELASLKKGVLERVNRKEDDVRIYPIRHPGVLWAGGRQEKSLNGLYGPSPEKQPQGLPAKIRSLFGWKTT